MNPLCIEKPLMLKDFLELDSCSSFQCVPRRVWAHNASTIETELCGGSSGARFNRSRSKGVFTKISAAVKNLHLSSPNRTFLPKSFFSKKLISRSFWNKKKETEVEKSPLYFPSPILSSSSSSCSESDQVWSSSTESVLTLSSNGSFDCSATGERDTLLHESPKRNIVGADNEINREEEEQCDDEAKEQLSPVSVMDFSYQVDDTEDEKTLTSTTSPPYFYRQSLNRTKHELLQKIRLFESLAELDPTDLSESFTNLDDDHVAASDKEDMASDLDFIQQSRSDNHLVGPHKKLLSDLYAEGLTWNTDMELQAEDWIRGHNHLAMTEHGKAHIADMERNRPWEFFDDEKEEVAADVEVEVLSLLVEEVVFHILLSPSL